MKARAIFFSGIILCSLLAGCKKQKSPLDVALNQFEGNYKVSGSFYLSQQNQTGIDTPEIITNAFVSVSRLQNDNMQVIASYDGNPGYSMTLGVDFRADSSNSVNYCFYSGPNAPSVFGGNGPTLVHLIKGNTDSIFFNYYTYAYADTQMLTLSGKKVINY